MEQSKWIMVRRESTFERFKRKLKKLIFNFFGIEEVDNQERNKTNSNKKSNEQKSKITIEIII